MKDSFIEKISRTEIKDSAEDIVSRFIYHLKYSQGKDQFSASPMDCYLSFAAAVKDILLDRWLKTQPKEYATQRKRVYYLSLEYLIGRSLGNAILNLDLNKQSAKALEEMGFDLSLLSELEWDAGLGNGGLGRLAACFLDSLATLQIPAFGYGIRYEYGIFFQHIKNGEQIETPDNWLRYGSIWETAHPERLFPVQFGGYAKEVMDADGHKHSQWIPGETVMAMAYDYLIPGFQNNYVNTLRLWSAKSSRDFDLSYFNEGDYVQAVADKNHGEMISKVLYPKDNKMQGKELRLKQEYFFVCATLQDILRRFFKKDNDLRNLPQKAAIQMNDTHPAIAVAEMMRLMVDEKNLAWEKAWEITQACLAYTNHTIMPEALEKWQLSLFEQVLPRHLQIIYEINHRFLSSLRLESHQNEDFLRKVSIIEEEPVKSVRMANLAILGSHSVNGVSQLHSDLLKTHVFKEFYGLYPQRFNNKTNGITPRRWLLLCNPRLTDLITKAIGPAWQNDLLLLDKLISYQHDTTFLEDLAEVKQQNKLDFCSYIAATHKRKLNPDSIFDFQAKRIHEYKRQLLNALGVIHLILKLRRGEEVYPQSFFFAGKAAPGYYAAKLIIRFINALGAYIEHDKQLSEKLAVIFLPNYRVTLAERIMPAAEISKQISTAGTEASGTGNMKFALNGALTLGTLDGANVEMAEEIGQENMFIFGLSAEEVVKVKASGYNPHYYYEKDPELKRVVDSLVDGSFDNGSKDEFRAIWKALMEEGDTYLHLADFRSFVDTSARVDELYRQRDEWVKKAILNVARMGKFSSDRAIKEYARDIWKIEPMQLDFR